MKIARMKIDDYDAIYQIWSRSEGVTLRSIDDSKEGISRFLVRNPNNNFTCRVDGNIVGGILAGHDGRKGFIYHTVVDEQYRGRGIGKKLVQKVVDAFKKERITKIGVLVNADNHPGNGFWASLGFAHADDLNYRLLPLDPSNT